MSNTMNTLMSKTVIDGGGSIFWRIVAWGIGLFAILQVGRLPIDDGHLVCGAWGCGPPLQALVAWHGFWILLLAGPLTIGGRYLDRPTQTRAALLVGGIGLLGILGIVAWDLVAWYPSVSEFQQQFLLQRCLFSVATTVDLPVIALAVAGFGHWLWLIATRPSASEGTEAVPSATVETEGVRVSSPSA